MNVVYNSKGEEIFGKPGQRKQIMLINHKDTLKVNTTRTKKKRFERYIVVSLDV